MATKKKSTIKKPKALAYEDSLTKMMDTSVEELTKEYQKKQSNIKSYSKMTEQELKALGNQLVSMLNKRIRRMEQKGDLSQAYIRLEQERGQQPRFSIDFRGTKLTKEERKKRLIDEIKRMEEYKKLATSSLRGTTKQKTRFRKQLKRLGVAFINKDEEKLFMSMYERWKELAKDNPRLHKVKPSESMKMLKDIYDRYASRGVYDEKKMFEALKRKIYKEEREKSLVEKRETQELYTRKRGK